MRIDFDELNHVYLVDGVKTPSVTQILKAEGFIDTGKYASGAASFGTAVHQMLEFYDQGELDDTALDDRLRPYQIAWMTFLGQTGYNVKEIEIRLASALGYAGTIDRVLEKDGKLAICDIKSGSKVAYHPLQVSAYSALYKEWNKLKTWPDRIVVYLNNEGKYNVEHCTDLTHYALWNSILSIHNWKKNNL
jgi:hypothetical protein